ncbi:MAG: hypothetical protein LBV13_02355 [Methanomassiliicoccaceae archaeon]|nr:hypothetical protein [Methanomassiliicoccaceae archaeon]
MHDTVKGDYPFNLRCFADCDINDPFFDSLKEDYPDFEKWFRRKADKKEKAYVHLADDSSIQAFLYLKDREEEAVGTLPPEPRMKIGTIKICDTSKRRRLGEGAIGIALWNWQKSGLNEIYVTVFPKHKDIIGVIETHGFTFCCKKDNGENVYMKDRRKLDHSDPKRSFSFISPDFSRGRYIPINDVFHDKMFQYSELKNTPQLESELPVSNGIAKTYIATPAGKLDYKEGDLAFIYRKYTGTEYKPSFKSVVTSFCTVTNVIVVKESGIEKKNFEDFCNLVGNKTVYSEEELRDSFSKSNVYVVEMLYNGYFGAGNNVNYNKLVEKGLWGKSHPYNQKLTREQSVELLKIGGKDVRNVIIDKSKPC